MIDRQQTLNAIGAEILDASITVHRLLGPGLLESCYRLALAHELRLRNMKAEEHFRVPLMYKDVLLGNGFEIDIWVENEVIVECKSVAELPPVAMAQIITYLKLKPASLGYLINFNVPRLIDGFKRVVYRF